MRVTIETFISGSRDGAPWPPKGEVIDLPTSEAAAMIAAGMASVADVPLEAAVAPTPETPAAPTPETPAPVAPETPVPAADPAPAADGAGKTKGA